jgi:hypothetical protein
LALAGVVEFRILALRQLLKKRPPVPLLVAMFGAWSVLSAAWSPYADHIQAPKLAAMICGGLVFAAAPGTQRLTRAGGAAAFLMLAILLGIEAVGGLPLNHAAQPDAEYWRLETNPAIGAIILMALGWGLTAMLLGWRGGLGRALAAVTLVVVGALATQFHQLANLVGFGLGLAAFLAALAAPRIAPLATTGALAAWMLTAPWATPAILGAINPSASLPFSWAVREAIWTYVCAHVGDAFWFGHGLDASRAVTDTISVQGELMPAIPLHPHSASLHIWYETGFIGAAIAAIALIGGGRALARTNHRAVSAAACGCLASLGFIANVSYGAWQEWWIATMFLAAAMAAAVGGAKP